MDKYLMLIHDLEIIIKILEEEIEKKKEEQRIDNETYHSKCESQKDIVSKIKEIEQSIAELNLYDNKNLFIASLKFIIESLVNQFKEGDLSYKLLDVLIVLLLGVISFAIGVVPVLGVVGGSFLLVSGINALGEYLFRKKNDMSYLERELRLYNRDLQNAEEFIAGHEERQTKFSSELEQLEEERKHYSDSLEMAKKGRTDTIERLVPEQVLDQEFDKSPLSEVLKKVREKKSTVPLEDING